MGPPGQPAQPLLPVGGDAAPALGFRTEDFHRRQDAGELPQFSHDQVILLDALERVRVEQHLVDDLGFGQGN